MKLSRHPFLRISAAAIWFFALAASLGAYTQANLQTAADGTIETIPLEASVQASPPQIRIKTYAPGTFTIYRKSPSTHVWNAPVATGVTLAAEGIWTDSAVSIGTLYEYRFVNTSGTTANSIHPSGYILCGIQVDATQPKGRMAVVVAADVLTSLAAEFAQYKDDLTADGWTVHEIPVPRAANYSGLGNGAILTLRLNAGGSGYVNSDYVTLTNASGKIARGRLAATNGVVTSITIPAGGGGSGFSVNESLTISGGSPSGTGATLIGRVNAAEHTLKYPTAITGGSGYTQGQTVTLTGVVSGRTAQATITNYPAGSVYWLNITSSQTGFFEDERLIMTGNTTGSGVGTILADFIDGQGRLTQAGIYTTGSGYIEGDAVTLTGGTSGKTAQAILRVNSTGVILSMQVVSSQSGFIEGETLTMSGASAGSGIGPFVATVGGPLQSVQVVSGGSGYVNGNVVTFNYGTTPAQGVLNVTNGVITSITLTSGGAGYTDGNYVYLVGLQSAASGASVSVATVDNSHIGRAVNVTAGGAGYRDNDRVTITGLSSGATATGSLIAPSGSITGVSVVLPAAFAAGESLALTPASGLGGGATATATAALSDYHLVIRGAIQGVNNAYPGELKNLALIGRVPVARSGLSDGAGADGHGNVAPYGTDAFYADTDGVLGVDWTDLGENPNTSANANVPGDRQFDQRKISEVGNGGRVELGYGRIDLSHGIQTETEALRTYFRKLHRYKTASPDFRPGRRVVDRWTYANGREAQLQSMPGVVGMNNVEFITNAMLPRVRSGQDADQLYTTQNGPYLFFFKGNGGPSEGVGGRAVFWTGMQSHWGYWYEASRLTSGANIMQKSLSEDNFTLSYTWNIWGLRYIYHRLGMGFDAGDMMRQSINNRGWTTGADGGPYTYKFNNQNNGDYHGSLYMNHMGDPALRLFMFEPPSALSVVKNGARPALSWTPSADAQVIGYHVYRAPHLGASFTRLTATPVAGNSFTDNAVTSGGHVYKVRAVRLETTGGGTFYNASLGAIQSINLDVAPTPVSIATTTFPVFHWNSPATVSLSAQGGVPRHQWSLASGALPAGLGLSDDGLISGTPTATGAFGFTARVTDQIGQSATRAFTLTVQSTSAFVLYPEATTYTDKNRPTSSFGVDEIGYISNVAANQHETFQRYDLSGLALHNGFVRATLHLYVTSGTAAGTIAKVQANLLADTHDGWIDRGFSRPFTGASNNGSGRTRIACPGHGFATGTQVSLAGLSGTGAPSTGPYTITVVDADHFDLLTVNFGAWTYDPALAFVSTTSMTYATRPTSYHPGAPTLTGSGSNTPGSLLQFDVTPFVRETLANDPLRKLGLRFFTTTPQTIAVGAANAYGAARPYIVFETSDAPRIEVQSPLADPACIYSGSGILLSTTVTPLPARAGTLALQWSQVSGPGSVVFTNAASPATGANFGAPGDYVLRLTAHDGVEQSFRDIPVRVLSAPVTGPADASLKLRLALDETGGSTAADSSGTSPTTHGVLVNSPAWSASGRIGRALAFSGGLQRVEVPDSAANTNPLDGFPRMTISLWFKADSLPVGGSAYAGILTKRIGPFNRESYRVELRGGTGNSSIYVTIAGGTSLVGATTVAAGHWYHLCVVFDGSLTTNNLQLYINGSPDRFSTITPTAVLRNNTSPLRVGSNDAFDFFGTIDEVRIYNRALGFSEIQDLAAAAPANMGPVVSAGAALSGEAGELLQLSGSASDDGRLSAALTLAWTRSAGPGEVVFGNASAASSTATFSQAGEHTLTLTASDGAITTFAQTTAAIAAASTGIDAWRMAYFGTTDATDDRADTASAAGDGMANLLKYALGLDPTRPATATSAGLELEVRALEGASYLSYRFTGTVSDVTYIVEATGDLNGAWTLLYTHTGSAPGDVRVDDTQPLSAVAKRFMRLRVTRP